MLTYKRRRRCVSLYKRRCGDVTRCEQHYLTLQSLVILFRIVTAGDTVVRGGSLDQVFISHAESCGTSSVFNRTAESKIHHRGQKGKCFL